MKKCLVLINNSGIGGAERRFAQYYKFVSEKDNDLYLIINSKLYKLLIKAEINLSKCKNVKVLNDLLGNIFTRGDSLSFFIKKIDYILFTIYTVRHMIKEKLKVLHLVLGGVYIALPIFYLSKDTKIIISVVNPALEKMVGSRIGYYLYLTALKKANIIDALSRKVKADLIRHNISERKISVSECSFVDNDKFKPDENKKDWVVFAGRFIDIKNPLLFIEAIPYIIKSFNSARFFILGDGPLKPEMFKRIGELKIGTHVEVKFIHDIGSVLSASRIFVSVQKKENYPSQSLLEAMACENAIIATNKGETRRLVDKEVGILIDEDPHQLADAVIKLLKDPALTFEMGRKAREKVLREHNISAFVGYFGNLYKKITEGS